MEAFGPRNGSVVLGAWCVLPHPFVVEAVARSGVDWICVDLQHGLMDPSDALPLFQAAAITRTPALSRVPSLDPAAIMRVLDFGARGVIVPMVETADHARELVSACLYPPQGLRSWGPMRPALTTPGYTAALANKLVICGANVETAKGIENLEEIAAVDGLGLVTIGPNDLALSMGVTPGSSVNHPGAYEEALRMVPQVCARHGVISAIFANSLGQARQYVEWGYRAIWVIHDGDLFTTAARAAVDAMRQELPRTTGSEGEEGVLA